MQLLRQAWADVKALTRSGLGIIREYRGRFALLAFGVALLAALVHPQDTGLYHRMTDRRSDRVRAVARRVSHWGDLQRGSLIVAAVVWGVGVVRKKRRWQAAGIACLLAALLAGAVANVARPAFGRPRPSTEVPDGFYGLRFTGRYHSFPSAHSCTSFGTAAALAVAVPAVGLPSLAGAAAVAWSRMYMREHYLSDVIAGAGVGIWFGIALGLAVRRRANGDRTPSA
ncbi:MAG: phosphatase PAP2 family protein [Verrucomicrobiota bacterium]